ncbi:MAG: UDP-2,3-diacylglucosamine diphosphatase LpxI [Planctomycetota bacterium]
MTILPDPPPPPTPIGVIAGGGRLPILIAQNLRRVGHEVHGLGLYKQFDPVMEDICTTFREVPLLRVGTWGKTLRRQGVRHAIMVGNVDKATLMHDPWRLIRCIPDAPTALGWYRKIRHDRRSYAILAAIAEELDRNGVSLMDSTSPIPDHLANAGVMTRARPTRQQDADIAFVWPILAQILRLDVGQSIAVRDRDVVAVEAVEGTDRLIERSGHICRAKGWTLCKGARMGHDRRSDVPTVGLTTIERLHAAGGRCLALAAGDVIMIDRDRVIEEADRLGIAIVGVPISAATEAGVAMPMQAEVVVRPTQAGASPSQLRSAASGQATSGLATSGQAASGQAAD